jgi:predicted transcriptional regulator YdeE
MSEFKVTVLEREAFKVVGLKVRTDMESAANDAPKLWESGFGPRMPEVASFPATSYGVSTMTDETHFDYMAALPWREGDPVPQGLEVFEVSGGLFAECPMNSIEELMLAYQYVICDWLPKQTAYEVAEISSYEAYPADHMESGKLTLYFPVKKK